MKLRKIKAHKITKRDRECWRVIAPADIRGDDPRENFFDVKEDANDYIEELNSRRGSVVPLKGVAIVEQVRLARCLERCGSIDRLESAVDSFLKTNPSTLVPLNLTEAIAKVIEEKRKTKMREVYVEQLEDVLNIFRKGRETKPVAEITKAEVDDWVRNPKLSAWTQIGYLGRVKTLFSFCKENNYVAVNPTDGIKKPKTDDGEICVMPLDEAKRLLKVALEHDKEIAFYYAIQMFGFMRPSEALRHKLSDFQKPNVIVIGSKAKTRSRRVIPVNATLRAWINLKADLPRKGVRERSDKMRALAKVTWGKDILRHSCISNSYPINGAMKTSEWSGHSEEMLFHHYRAVTEDEAARLWWEMAPEAIAQS